MNRLRDAPHYIRILFQMAQEHAATLLMRLRVLYWGVGLGRASRFVGLASIQRCRGSKISIGPRGRFLSATRSNRHGLNRGVVIEDDVFIGMHTMILKGVTIGRGAVIAAGSVVTQNVPAGSIYGGTPARLLAELPAEKADHE